MLVFLEIRTSVRWLRLQLSKTSFKLNFSARYTACWSETQVHLAYYLERSRLNASPKRKATLHSANLSRELFHLVNRILTKYCRFLSAILNSRSLVLMCTPGYVWSWENMTLNCLSMRSGLRLIFKSSSLRSIHNDSMLDAKAVLSCS